MLRGELGRERGEGEVVMGLSEQVGCSDIAVIGRYKRVISRYKSLFGCHKVLYITPPAAQRICPNRNLPNDLRRHFRCKKQEKALYSASGELANGTRAGPEQKATKLPSEAGRLTVSTSAAPFVCSSFR